MANLTEISTHVADAKARLLERHKGKPNINAMVELFSSKIQALETAAFYFFSHRWINEAEGVQLDLIGELVGQNRLGFEDEFYRVLLFVKIAINNSQGDPEAIISIFNLMTGANKTRYLNFGNGNFTIQGNGLNPLSTAAQLVEQMQRVALAGVKVTIMGFTSDTPFTFAGGTGGGYGFFNPLAAENGEFGENLGGS